MYFFIQKKNSYKYIKFRYFTNNQYFYMSLVQKQVSSQQDINIYIYSLNFR